MTVVENLAVLGVAVTEAEHTIAAAQHHLDAAREEYTRGYRAARDHGWSASELHQLGCEPVTTPRRVTTTRATPQTSTDNAAGTNRTTDQSGPSNADETPPPSATEIGGH